MVLISRYQGMIILERCVLSLFLKIRKQINKMLMLNWLILDIYLGSDEMLIIYYYILALAL